MSTFALDQIQARLPQALLERYQDRTGQAWGVVAPERIAEVARLLKENLGFRLFISMDAVDRLPLEPGENRSRFEVIYFLKNMERNEQVGLKVRANEDEEVPSITAVFQEAEAAERFVWDFYGVPFKGVFPSHQNRQELVPDSPTDEEASTGDTLASQSSDRLKLPFQSWDRYRIVSFLGGGGMGTVYKAHDLRLRRTVAIKFLRSGQADESSLKARQRRHFEREARAQARIDHPHICKIFEVGEIEQLPYIAMQLIHGFPLSALKQTLSREEKVRIVQQVAEALQAAHDQKLIHRDLKPRNVMVERKPDGTYWPYLMDFGLAKELDSNTQTSKGGVEGTPAYMAPEQARGDNLFLDERTDIYGLGSMLYFVLAGRAPFVGSRTEVLMAVILDHPPRLRTLDPSIPEALQTIAEKALEKDPAKRYPSAKAFADDVSRFLEGQRIRARPLSLLRQFKRFALKHKLLVGIGTTLFLAAIVLGWVVVRYRLQANEQARLAQELGQEITQMEWMLRSARQLPIHDLEREKTIIRRRMATLQNSLAGYGPLSRGLAHDALGRGHLALHEYQEAETELAKAAALGISHPDLDSARGLVLGKLYDQAMYEARLAGGGDFANTKEKELSAKYLAPALSLLLRSRTQRIEQSPYLDALIASFRKDFERALRLADEALSKAPWLYEAEKLAGDVYLERALRARDTGKYEEAQTAFAQSVKRYEAAAAIGASDDSVYEGLAEAWLRQVEMHKHRGEASQAAQAHEQAVNASDKIRKVAPANIAGPLKRASSFSLSMGGFGFGAVSSKYIESCLAAAEEVLKQSPRHPYASDVAAGCLASQAEAAQAQGKDPLPSLVRALSVLEPVVKAHPQFLWGTNDLGLIYFSLGMHHQRVGDKQAQEMFVRAFEQYTAVVSLDPHYSYGTMNVLAVIPSLVREARSFSDISVLLAKADDWYAKCSQLNDREPQCPNNYFQSYAQAARRLFLAGEDATANLEKGLAFLEHSRKLGGPFLDAEQHAALLHVVQAQGLAESGNDPQTALVELQKDLAACFRLLETDVTCRTLDARGELARLGFLMKNKRPLEATKQAAFDKATLATRNPAPTADAWQTLAEVYRALGRHPMEDSAQAQAALDKALSINPRHAPSLLLRGEIFLAQARFLKDKEAQSSQEKAAEIALTQALEADPLLEKRLKPLLDSIAR